VREACDVLEESDDLYYRTICTYHTREVHVFTLRHITRATISLRVRVGVNANFEKSQIACKPCVHVDVDESLVDLTIEQR
jgi:hypothetical protein